MFKKRFNQDDNKVECNFFLKRFMQSFENNGFNTILISNEIKRKSTLATV